MDTGGGGGVGEVRASILEETKERIWRRDLEFRGGGASGHVGNSNLSGATDRPIIEA